MKTYRTAFISPGREGSVVSGQWKGFVNFYRLTLPLLAGLTPTDRYQIELFDESVETITTSTHYDLVAMSVMTPYAPRAYALAEEYRRRGTTVVLGGQHPTLLPQEAVQHADAIAIGDAEQTWPTILADFEQGSLQKVYSAQGIGASGQHVVPRRDLLRKKSLLVFNTVETSRGCPYVCDYCTIASIYHAAYRKYSIDSVMADIASLPGKYLFFVDDNLIGGNAKDRQRTKELLREISGLNKQWFCQATIQMADDKELLDLAAKAGCRGVYLGLESISQDSLAEVKKAWNKPQSYSERIRRIRDHGIAIEAGLIFGFDHDGPDVFKRTAEFVYETKVESPNAHILTPYPGTPLFERLQETGRIKCTDWEKYNTGNVVYQPAMMTAEQLQAGYEWWYRTVFSPSIVLDRIRSANFRHYTALINLAKSIEVRRKFGRSSQLPEHYETLAEPAVGTDPRQARDNIVLRYPT